MPIPDYLTSQSPESGEHVVEIRNNLPVYLQQVGQGKSVLIKKYDKPFAVLAPYGKSLPEGAEVVKCTTTELRPKISELLHQVHYNNLYILLTKRNKPVALIMPLDGSPTEITGK